MDDHTPAAPSTSAAASSPPGPRAVRRRRGALDGALSLLLGVVVCLAGTAGAAYWALPDLMLTWKGEHVTGHVVSSGTIYRAKQYAFEVGSERFVARVRVEKPAPPHGASVAVFYSPTRPRWNVIAEGTDYEVSAMAFK